MNEYAQPNLLKQSYPLTSSPRQFQEFVAQRSADQLCKWLRTGFTQNIFPPFRLSYEPSPARQLQSAYARLQPDLRERFKEATVRAVSEWQLDSSDKPIDRSDEKSYVPLLDLIDLAASIRAEAIITVLREKLTKQYLPNPNTPKAVIALMFAAIQGFAPHTEVQKFFSEIYPREDLIAPYAAQLFLGLCACDPNNYAQYLSGFVHLAQRYPRYYSMPHIINRFESIVTPEQIVHGIEASAPDIQEPFLEWLCNYKWSPASLHPPIGERAGEDTFLFSVNTRKHAEQALALEGDPTVLLKVVNEEIEKTNQFEAVRMRALGEEE